MRNSREGDRWGDAEEPVHRLADPLCGPASGGGYFGPRVVPRVRGGCRNVLPLATAVRGAIEVFTRECLALEAASSFPSSRVTLVLDRLIARRKPPDVLQLDNGTEFTCRHFDTWAFARGIRLDFIRPGRPVENAFIESLKGRLRDECLNVHWWTGLDEAQQDLENWRRHYNEVKPHSSLADLVPAAYVAQRWAQAHRPRKQPRRRGQTLDETRGAPHTTGAQGNAGALQR